MGGDGPRTLAMQEMLFAATAAIGIGEMIYTLMDRSCLLSSENIFSDTCKPSMTALMLLQCIKAAMIWGMLTWEISKKVNSSSVYKFHGFFSQWWTINNVRHKLPTSYRVNDSRNTRADGDDDPVSLDDSIGSGVCEREIMRTCWAPASSRDVFEDTVKVGSSDVLFPGILGTCGS